MRVAQLANEDAVRAAAMPVLVPRLAIRFLEVDQDVLRSELDLRPAAGAHVRFLGDREHKLDALSIEVPSSQAPASIRQALQGVGHAESFQGRTLAA